MIQAATARRATRALLQFEQSGGVGAEMDHWHARLFQILQDRRHVRQDVFLVVSR